MKNIPIFYVYYTPYDIPKNEKELNDLKYYLSELFKTDISKFDFIKFDKSYKKNFS
jgi:hypothetical protein